MQYLDKDSGIKVTSNSPVGDKFLIDFVNITNKYEDNKKLVIKYLRDKYNVKAIHPDDGWVNNVNKENNEIRFCYPIYIDFNIMVGDLVAVGWPESVEDIIGEYRILPETTL